MDLLDHDNLEEFAGAALDDDENALDREERGFFLARAARYGASVFDLACGTGRLTIPIAAAGHRCQGIDLASAMLVYVCEKA